MVCGRRTSMRLEPSMWLALEDIAKRERMNINELCSRIKRRVDKQAESRGLDPEDNVVTLSSAVRVFIVAYYRCACDEESHRRAGHGLGNPFVGTSLDEGNGEEADEGPEQSSSTNATGGHSVAAGGLGGAPLSL